MSTLWSRHENQAPRGVAPVNSCVSLATAHMEGGRPEVQKVPDPWLDEHGLRARALYELEHGEGAPLNATIAPEVNKLVTFRGDAHHRVRPFAAAADDRRVSIVLESYVLPRLDIWRARRLVPAFQIG